MINRRNIRIKVMQALFAYEQNWDQTPKGIEAKKNKKGTKTPSNERELLQESIDQSAILFYTLLNYICQTALYAATDAQIRAKKLTATTEDKNANTKLADNILIKQLWEDASFQEKIKEFQINNYTQQDSVKALFKQLSATEEYQKYLTTDKHKKSEDKKIVFYIWETIMVGNEQFVTEIADSWPNWEDDVDLMQILINNYFNKPTSLFFSHFLSKEKKEYAYDLLATTIDKESHLLSFIKPKLRNWDMERIAQIDMILLKMGLSEFLYFPTIPPKVTINEYIEIAKQYSTDQSGQFVNGVLDNLRKNLEAENKLRKISFRK